MSETKPLNLKKLHEESDGISPYLKCPWCGYCDVIGEFMIYHHPSEPMNGKDTSSTQCGQCLAAGNTAWFVLAHDEDTDLGEDNQYKVMWLSELDYTPKG